MANHKAVQTTNGNHKKRQVAELSDFDREMLGSADAGISDSALDNIIPQIKVLQPLSPEIVDAKVEGARAGDFLIAGAPVRGADGVWFQPCAQAHRWFEFKPIDDGGGFVAEHPFQVNSSGDPIVDERGDPIPPRGAVPEKRYRLVMPSGNEVVHYRQWAGIAWVDGQGLEYAINFKSTGHTVAKDWMTKARRLYLPGTTKRYPLWSHVYKLTTSQRRNNAGTWFVIDVGNPVKLANSSAIDDWHIANDMGRALADAFGRKEKTVGVDQGEEAAVAASADAM